MKRYLQTAALVLFPIVMVGSVDRPVRPDEIAQLQEVLGGEVANDIPDLEGIAVVAELDQPPVRVNYEPVLPTPDAWQHPNRWTEIEVWLLINEQGRVEDVVVLQCDFAKIAESFVDVVSDWEFSPPMKQGVAVKCSMRLPGKVNIERMIRNQNQSREVTASSRTSS